MAALTNIVYLFRRAGVNFLRHWPFGGNRRCRFRCSPSRKIRAAGDQTRAALISYVGPRPLDENQQAIAESDQEQDVHKQPGQPGDESRNVNLSELRHGSGSSDGGEAAFVPVVEGGTRVKTPTLPQRTWQG